MKLCNQNPTNNFSKWLFLQQNDTHMHHLNDSFKVASTHWCTLYETLLSFLIQAPVKDCLSAVYLLKISKYTNQTKIYRFIFVISLQPKKNNGIEKWGINGQVQNYRYCGLWTSPGPEQAGKLTLSQMTTNLGCSAPSCATALCSVLGKVIMCALSRVAWW